LVDYKIIFDALFLFLFKFRIQSEMTSVLYSGGLNYQAGNPVRQEIVAVRREVDSLRKQVDLLTEENGMYKKYLMRLFASEEDKSTLTEFTRDMQSLNEVKDLAKRDAGGATVQGGGFRR
jgi:AraC-like DNA-binding protein